MTAKKSIFCRVLKAITALFAVGTLVYLSLLTVVLGGAKDRVIQQPGTMIVLGCQVHPWGPSILLQDRLDTAADYLLENPEVQVIVSGGQGPDEHTSEAQVMSDYLEEKGVSPERIFREDRSHNTWQNLNYTVELMEREQLATDEGVILVSSGFHLTRAKMLWERITGHGETLSVLAAPSTHAPSRLWMHIREPLALVKSFVFDR